MTKTTYKDSGVDLELYGKAMAQLPSLLKRTHSPRVLPSEGGFAGLFQLDFSGQLFSRNYVNPVLVSATDGGGTKLKVAQKAGIHNTIGIDLVAMCVNDALCTGAEPLFFLDYVAMSKADPARLKALVEGITTGCLQGHMALVGGETAIMPDLYQVDDYALAGFCVGVVERQKILDGSAVTAGDTIIGLASSGLHSNGYSLVRKVVFELAGLEMDDWVESCQATVGELLLEPTTIYVQAVRSVLNHYKVKGVVHGIAHITGGGLHENLARSLNPRVDAQIQAGSWDIPPLFDWLQEIGNIDQQEMERVFNMGIGLVLVVSPYFAESIQQQLTNSGHENWILGSVVEGTGTSGWA